MKRRIIYWIAGVGIFLLLANCHWIMPPLRRADAVVTLQTTGYCASMQCTGWRFNWLGMPVCAAGPDKGNLKIIGQTASGWMARPGTVAVDPSVFPVGTKFYIPGYGWGIAEDIGGGINDHHLDLYFRQHRTAARWGTQTKQVKVWYPKH